LVITRNKVAFLTSHRKGVILDALVTVSDDILVLKRDKEVGRGTECFEKLWSLIEDAANAGNHREPVKLGVIPKDKNEGSMIGEWISYADGKSLEKVDVTADIGSALAVKDSQELENISSAAKLTSLLMTEQVAKKVLGAVEESKKTTHVQIADEVEAFVTNHLGRLRSKIDSKVNLEFVDVCYPPIIQSGGVYSLKPSALSTEDLLCVKGGPIICSVGLRYRAYCANMSRTFLINPLPKQEENLAFLQTLQQYLATKLIPDAIISDIYQAGVNFVRDRRPDLEGHLAPNFGFGIGLEFRAAEFLINSRCNRKVQAGMVFNLIVGLQDVKGDSSGLYSLLTADTVQVVPNGSSSILLTSGLNQLKELSYSIKDRRQTTAPAGTPIIKTRLRSQAASGSRDESTEKRRREHQKELGQLRIKEALERYASTDEANDTSKKSEILKFESYRKDTMLPKELGAGGSLKVSTI
jgi:nucleosome binding factor SPN SPT16 subunit